MQDFLFRLFLDIPYPQDPIAKFEEMDRTQWERAIEHEQNQELLPILFWTFKKEKINVPDWVMEKLEKIYAKSVAIYEHQKRATQEIMEILKKHKIKAGIYKGDVIGEKLYERPELRPKIDLDFLIKNHEFEQCCDVLKKNGWVKGTALYYHTHFKKNGVLLEAHRRLYGYGESILYNITQKDFDHYVDNGFNTEEGLAFTCIQLFNEYHFNRLKIMDAYLYLKKAGVDLNLLDKLKNKYSALLPLKILDSIIFHYSGTHEITWFNDKTPASLWHNQEKWKRWRFPLLFFYTDKKLTKIFKILFPTDMDLKDIYKGRRISQVEHFKNLFKIFWGINRRARA
jgi:hypothetical protein